MIIENLFPLPIGFFEVENPINESELNFVNSQETRPNEGNVVSVDNYILKNDKIINIRNFIEKSVAEYFTATVNPKNDVSLRITQSWLNYTKPGQYHHKHAHPNSLISGVFYIGANPMSDKIFFYNEEYKQFRFTPSDWNMYNSSSWWYPVRTGLLILFPSSLVHMVHAVEGVQERISLAFNTFPVGDLGEENDLTALKLEK